jgi:hypothetical protein
VLVDNVDFEGCVPRRLVEEVVLGGAWGCVRLSSACAYTLHPIGSCGMTSAQAKAPFPLQSGLSGNARSSIKKPAETL